MKKVKEPAPHEKAAQIEKEAVRALSVDEVEEALTKSTYGGDEDLKKRLTEAGQTIYELRKDMETLKAECLALKDENKKYLREIDDYKKTISKMKYAHEEEVRALNDDIAEAKAEANAARKSKEEALGKYNGAVDMLDSDSVAFGAILDLAHVAQSVSQSLYRVSKRIEAETEGHI